MEYAPSPLILRKLFVVFKQVLILCGGQIGMRWDGNFKDFLIVQEESRTRGKDGIFLISSTALQVVVDCASVKCRKHSAECLAKVFSSACHCTLLTSTTHPLHTWPNTLATVMPPYISLCKNHWVPPVWDLSIFFWFSFCSNYGPWAKSSPLPVFYK